MAWYKDLHPCPDFGTHLSMVLRAVGWLERGHPYTTGDFDPEPHSALSELAKDPWEPIVVMGGHACSLGKESGDFTNSEMGARNLFIPGLGAIFDAPELILHYMKHHGYRPPEEFREAAFACSPMWSGEYFSWIERNGGACLQSPTPRPSLAMILRQKVVRALKRLRFRG